MIAPLAVEESSFSPPRFTDRLTGMQVQKALHGLPLYFIENRGQVDERVAYYLQGRDKSVYFTCGGLTFVLSETENASPEVGRYPASLDRCRETRTSPGNTRPRWGLKLDFVGANPNVAPIGREPADAVISYFKGPEEEWKTGLRTFNSVVYPDLWPGIDLVYSGAVNRMKYSFVVHPGADPGQIQWTYRGAGKVTLNPSGALEVHTPVDVLADEQPYTYQEGVKRRTEVDASYVLALADEGEIPVVGFHLGPYDRGKTLVIDPAVLLYAGFIGGSADDSGYGIAVDSSGNAYVTGRTASLQASFPDGDGFGAVPGFDQTHNGNTDVFVCKVTASGSALTYCTYVGGSGVDEGTAVAVDSSDNAYVTGTTNSANFPVTMGPDLTHNGNDDAFVFKLDAAGTSLSYCGFIGGSGVENTGFDFVGDIAVDGSGNAYVTGETNSDENTFPDGDGFDSVTGPDLTHNGNEDAFVCKVNAAGTALTYCTYIGGSGTDHGNGIALDSSDNAYVAGTTTSVESSFPDGDGFDSVPGHDVTFNGNKDGYVCKINAAGTSFSYCTYIGGASFDSIQGAGIAVDGSGNAYVSGDASSDQTTFPDGDGFGSVPGFDQTYNGGQDAFVCKLTAAGTGLTYCTYIGSSNNDIPFGIAVDSNGNAYMVGRTDSTEANFPVTVGPDLTHNGGIFDACVCKLNVAGTSLDYCGYIGGNSGGGSNDRGFDVAVDSAGNAYVTGDTRATETTFPETVGPDLTQNGGNDAFVAKVSAFQPTSIQLSNFKATHTTSGQVALRWQSGYEADNLGYNLYIEQGGERIRLNSEIVGGSALLAGSGTPLTAGNSYVWQDLLPDSHDFTHYWLESVNLQGRSTWHGPILADLASAETGIRPIGRSRLLSRLGRVKEVALESSNAREVRAPLPALTPEKLDQQWSLAGKSAVKIESSEEGWYRVGQSQLVEQGLDPGVDPHSLQLFVDGQEQALLLEGDADGRFDAGDSIEFYGIGLEAASSEQRVYWLVAGEESGQRLKSARRLKSKIRTRTSFPFTLEHQDRSVYFPAALIGDHENFYGPVLLPGSAVEIPVTVHHLDIGSREEVVLEVALQGVTTARQNILVWVNGGEIGEVELGGQARAAASLRLSLEMLQEGENHVRLQSLQAGVSAVEYLRLTYPHTYTADQDVLRFVLGPGERVTVGGFSDPRIRLLDITDPEQVQTIKGAVRKSRSGFSITSAISASSPRTLLAVSRRGHKRALLRPNAASLWHRNQGAELVIIAHRNFLDSARVFQAHREAEGWTGALIDVEDIYDEFSFGHKTPLAIQAFLRHSWQEWQERPTHVLLWGMPVTIQRTTWESGILTTFLPGWWTHPFWRRPQTTVWRTRMETVWRRWRWEGFRLAQPKKRI